MCIYMYIYIHIHTYILIHIYIYKYRRGIWGVGFWELWKMHAFLALVTTAWSFTNKCFLSSAKYLYKMLLSSVIWQISITCKPKKPEKQRKINQLNKKKTNKPTKPKKTRFLTPRQMNVFWCHGSDCFILLVYLFFLVLVCVL